MALRFANPALYRLLEKKVDRGRAIPRSSKMIQALEPLHWHGYHQDRLAPGPYGSTDPQQELP